MSQDHHNKNKKPSLLRRGFLTAAFCLATLGAPTAANAQRPANNNNAAATSAPDTVLLWQGANMVKTSEVDFTDDFNGAIERENNLMSNPDNVKIENAYMARYAGLQNSDYETMASTVNQTVNDMVTYTTDPDQYNRDDYWASPVETVAYKRGDCEDYALLKYVTLRRLGVNANRLFIGIVDADGKDQENHAVLLMNIADDGKPQRLVVMSNGDDGLMEPDDSGYSYFSLINENGAWHYVPDQNTVVAQQNADDAGNDNAGNKNNDQNAHDQNANDNSGADMVALLAGLGAFTLVAGAGSALLKRTEKPPKRKGGGYNKYR